MCTTNSNCVNLVDQSNERILNDDEAATFNDFVSARTISAHFIAKKTLIVDQLKDEESGLWQYNVRELWRELFKRDSEFSCWVNTFGGNQILMRLMEDGFLLDLVEQGFECSPKEYPRLKKYREWLRSKEDRLWDQYIQAKARVARDIFLDKMAEQQKRQQPEAERL